MTSQAPSTKPQAAEEGIRRSGLLGRIGRWAGRTLEGKGRRARREAQEKARRQAQYDGARHQAWMRCHVGLCCEVARPGRPKRADLERWTDRLAGTNVVGGAVLADLKEVLATDLYYETNRALLRLALATNAVALSVYDPEVKAAVAAVPVPLGADTRWPLGEADGKRQIASCKAQNGGEERKRDLWKRA